MGAVWSLSLCPGAQCLAILPYPFIHPSIHPSILILALIDTSGLPVLQVWQGIQYDCVCVCVLSAYKAQEVVCGCPGREELCVRGRRALYIALSHTRCMQ